MRKGMRVVVASAAIVCLCALAGPAGANSQSVLDKLYSSTAVNGVESGIGNPGSSEHTIVSGTLALSSVWATNGLSGTSELGIQMGVLQANGYDWSGETGTCTSGHDTGYFYFTEKDDGNNNYVCDYVGNVVTTGVSHVQEVNKFTAGDGLWHPYLDGQLADTLYKSWPNACNSTGNACGVYAFAEEKNDGASCWQAKFSGTGNTAWSIHYSGAYHDVSDPDDAVKGADWTTNLDLSDPTDPDFPNMDNDAKLWYYIYKTANC